MSDAPGASEPAGAIPRVRSIPVPPRDQTIIEAYAAHRELIRGRASWDAVVQLYYWDRLEEAARLMQTLGTGEAASWLTWIRLIEAEEVSTRGSVVTQLTDWLELEYLPDEVGKRIDRLIPLILPACDRVCDLMIWKHGAPTRIAIMSAATEAPWATNPNGYCVDKYPYEKVCLPYYLLSDPHSFQEAVSHEYAHVATLNLSDARAPAWLEEAISMQFDSDPDREILMQFIRNEIPWLEPLPLNAAFRMDRQQEAEGVLLAYEQSLWIGKYLLFLGRQEGLDELLRTIGASSFQNWMCESLLGRERTDCALRRVYRRSEKTMFTDSLGWLRSGSAASLFV